MPTERKIANNPSLRFPTQFSLYCSWVMAMEFSLYTANQQLFLRAQNVRSRQKKARLDYLLTPSSLAQTFLSLFSFFSPELSFHFRTKEEQRGSKNFFLNNAIFFERRETWKSFSLPLPSLIQFVVWLYHEQKISYVHYPHDLCYCVESRVFNSENSPPLSLFHINFPGGKKFLFLFFPFLPLAVWPPFSLHFSATPWLGGKMKEKRIKCTGKTDTLCLPL